MKHLSTHLLTALLLTFLLYSCSNESPPETNPDPEQTQAQNKLQPEFQAILDSADLLGTILIFDASEEVYYSNDFTWCNTGKLPASTFKIPNSIIALETGVVENDSTLFKWDGTDRAFDIWEQDLIFRQAFQYSCVPCYQEVARKIGVKRMRAYLDKLDYGSIQVDSTNIDNFWLQGKSEITAFQQIDFLQRFYQSELPIRQSTKDIMDRVMLIKESEDYKLFGKTGWSIQGEQNNGWFVGYVETKDKVQYFAVNVEPKQSFDMDKFPAVRKEVAFQALQLMKVI